MNAHILTTVNLRNEEMNVIKTANLEIDVTENALTLHVNSDKVVDDGKEIQLRLNVSVGYNDFTKDLIHKIGQVAMPLLMQVVGNLNLQFSQDYSDNEEV